MKKNQWTTALLSLCGLTMTACGQVKTKVQVTEEDGTPIEGAEVKISYVAFKDEDWKVKILGTDPEGKVEDTGSAQLRIQLKVSKEGYYESNYRHRDGTALRRDQDHDLKVILRKKINPIPLYAKKVVLGMPRKNEWIGYDFKIGDMVSPDGQGRVADILFKIRSLPTDEYGKILPDNEKGRLEISFPGEQEGLLYEEENYQKESQLRLPHQAPTKTYIKSLNREEKNYANEGHRLNTGLFLRTRVIIEDKIIKEANYAKLASDFKFYPRESGWHVSHKGKPKLYGGVHFTYYFNPTPNDRNLEFDPQRNLFGKLDSDQRVLKP